MGGNTEECVMKTMKQRGKTLTFLMEALVGWGEVENRMSVISYE